MSLPDSISTESLILFAEDHHTNRKLLSLHLQKMGFALESVSNGQEALDAWRSGRFALVLTDCHMPVLDGFELAAAIREAERGTCHRTPIVALTADAHETDKARACEAGIDEFLTKPIEMQQLRERLTHWLAHGTQHPAHPGAAPCTTLSEAIDTQRSLAILDQAILSEMFGDNQSLTQTMLGSFRVANDEDVAALRLAIERADAAEIMEQAHRIKGAARLIGAMRLGAEAARLEQAAREADLGNILSTLPEFECQLTALNAAIDSFYQRIPPMGGL